MGLATGNIHSKTGAAIFQNQGKKKIKIKLHILLWAQEIGRAHWGGDRSQTNAAGFPK